MICPKCSKNGMQEELADGRVEVEHCVLCGYYKVLNPGTPSEEREDWHISSQFLAECNVDEVDPDRLYTTAEVGEFCGRSAMTVTGFITSGKLQAMKCYRSRNGRAAGGRGRWWIKGADYIRFAKGDRYVMDMDEALSL